MTGYERFRAALQSNPIALPEATPDAEPGQIWRASWDDATMNIYIDETSDSTVAATPVTEDVDGVANPRFFLEGDESPVGYDAVVLRTPRLPLPRFVLDGCYGRVSPVAEEMIEPIVELTERARQFDPGWQIQIQVQRTLSQLARGTWIPEVPAVGPIRGLMQRAGATARSVMEGLDMSQGVVAQLMDGSWWIDDDAMAGLIEILGVPADELPRQFPFEGHGELLYVIDTPRRRPKFRRLALGAGVSEAQARLDTSLHLLGARPRRARGELDPISIWNQLLDERLDRVE